MKKRHFPAIRGLRFLISSAVFTGVLCTTALCIPVKHVNETRQKLINCALSYEGSPYRYGGTDPKSGIDCSAYVGLVARKAAGINLPRTADAIYSSVKIISEKDIEPGDLLFFKAGSSGKITHVGIYCGRYHGPRKQFDGKKVFISAVSDGPSTGVQLSLMRSSFWKKNYFAVGRILPATK